MGEESPKNTETSNINLPKGMEMVTREEVQAHIDEANIQLSGTVVSEGLSSVRSTFSDLQDEASTRLAENTPHVSDVVKDIHQKRVDIDTQSSDARVVLRSEQNRERRLVEKSSVLGSLERNDEDVKKEKRVGHAERIDAVMEDFTISLAEAQEVVKQKKEEISDLKKQKKGIKYTPAVLRELGKIPTGVEAYQTVQALETSIGNIDSAEEQLVLYEAGLMAVSARIIKRNAEGVPVSEFILDEAKHLSKIQKSKDDLELKMARKVDRDAESHIADREQGEFFALVRGEHSKRDTSLSRHTAEMTISIKEQHERDGYSDEAVAASSNEIRILIEDPGKLKKPISDQYLTSSGLKEYEEQKIEGTLDPIRKAVFNRIKRHSVEDVLGCEVQVSEGEEGRSIEMSLKKDEEQEASTPLFQKLVESNQVELDLRKRLGEVDPKNYREVKVITEALVSNKKFKDSLLKLADSRINGVRTADGVKSGEIATVLADKGVKSAEAAALAGIVSGGFMIMGVKPNVEQAQEILAAPGKSQEIWNLINSIDPSMDINGLQQAIASHASEVGQKIAMETANKMNELSALFKQATDLNQLISLGAERAEELMEKAEAWKNIGIVTSVTAAAAAYSERFRSIFKRKKASSNEEVDNG